MTQNFSNAKIYKITNDYNDNIYVGSTCDTLIKRFSTHKRDYKILKNINRPIYKLMNEIGFDRFRIDLVEDYPCSDKQALRQREGYWIRNEGTLNKKIEGRTQKEYYENNKDKIKALQKEYTKNNKDKIAEYLNNNKEKIKERDREYRKEYRKEHAEKLKEYNRLYREKKKLEKQQLNI